MYGSGSNISKKRFNALDFLVVLIAVLAVVALIVTIVRESSVKLSEYDKEIYYIIETENIPTAIGGQVVKGQKIYDTESKEFIGTVSEVSVEPYKHKGRNTNGNIVETEVDGRITLYVKVKAKVSVDEKFYSIGGYNLAIGKSMSYNTDTAVLNGMCVSVLNID